MSSIFLKRIGVVIAALVPVAIIGAFVLQDQETAVAPTVNTSSSPSGTASPTTSSSSPTSTGNDVVVSSPSTTTSSGSSVATEVAVAVTTGTKPAAEDSSIYKDGTYTATGEYTSPEGPQSIAVTLTINNDVITAASIEQHAKVGTPSEMWQEKFAEGYKGMVVGKSIADLKLTKVSGSSLTPLGFNDAIAEIRTQAEV
jgi:cytoskeletal protein RodZ